MNQILFLGTKKNKKKLFLFVFQLVASISLFFVFVMYLINLSKSRTRDENFSRYLVKKVNISSLYSENYQTIVLNEPVLIIGTIKIEKINIEYPIFSYSSENLLKIGICRFYGPSVNVPGNLCVAGHNYDDYRFFSNLFSLQINDEIKIYDNLGNYINYYVYEKYEINSDDSSCIRQNTYGKREITLVTCNNLANKRLIIKAKE